MFLSVMEADSSQHISQQLSGGGAFPPQHVTSTAGLISPLAASGDTTVINLTTASPGKAFS